VDTAKMITFEDLKAMAERVVNLDRLVMRTGSPALQLMILNAPIKLKK